MVVRRLSLGRACQFLALLLVICWFAVPASASGATHTSATAHLLRAGVPAVADLDGDHRPDFASGINTGHSSAGYSYRVDIDLSNNTSQKSFSVLSEEPNGLNIQAIDVDGDHDLDLVITNRFSQKPIGVWINDGSGQFTPGDLGEYAPSVWETRQSVQSTRTAPALALHFEWRRPQLAIARESIKLEVSGGSLARVHFSPADISRTSIGTAQLRAPPISLI